jgi:hypothetical protein
MMQSVHNMFELQLNRKSQRLAQIVHKEHVLDDQVAVPKDRDAQSQSQKRGPTCTKRKQLACAANHQEYLDFEQAMQDRQEKRIRTTYELRMKLELSLNKQWYAEKPQRGIDLHTRASELIEKRVQQMKESHTHFFFHAKSCKLSLEHK